MNETKMTLTPRVAGDGGATGLDRSAAAGADFGRQPPRPGGWGRWILVVALIAASYLGYKHFTQPAAEIQAATDAGAATQPASGKSKHSGDRGSAQPVGVATIQPRDVHVIVNALGTVTPLATVTVVSQISGYLQQVAFTEGQRVKKGDFIAQIDPRPYQALKAQYEGQLAHDQGLLDQARVDDVRYQTLLKQNSIARQTADDQKYIVKQYEGTVAADQALIDAQALNIAYCHIISPVDGRIGIRQVDAGNFVQAGSSSSATGIAVVTQLQPMSVIFSVPEDALNKIAPKMRDGGKLTATAYDRANVKQLATGAVTVLDNQVDTTTGMVKLRAFFDNQDEALFPNQFVNIRLLVDTLQAAIAAPTAGVQHGAPGDYAYIVGADGKASVRVLKLGQTDGDFVQVLSGLAIGDRVVTDGADRLREGAEARVVSDSAQTGAAAVKQADAAPADPAAAGAAPADPSQGHQHHGRRQKDGAVDAPKPADGTSGDAAQ